MGDKDAVVIACHASAPVNAGRYNGPARRTGKAPLHARALGRAAASRFVRYRGAVVSGNLRQPGLGKAIASV
jgi:hypothetical protein